MKRGGGSFEKGIFCANITPALQWRSFLLEIPSTPSIMQILNSKETETFGAVETAKGAHRS